MHLSDKDLDRLSREAAEQYDVEQNTSGWDKLEQKLNKHLPAKEKKERRRFLFFIWMLALLTGGGLVWMLTGNHTQQTITLKEGSSPTSRVPSEDLAIDRSFEEGQSTKVIDNEPTGKTDDQKLVQEQQGLTPGKQTATQPENRVAQNDPSHNIQKSGENIDKPGRKPGPDKATSNRRKPAVQQAKNNPPKDPRIGETATLLAPIQGSGKKNNSGIKDNSSPATSDVNKADAEVPVPGTAQTEKSSVADSSKQSITQSAKPGVDSGTTAKKASVPKGKTGFDKGLVIGAVGAPDMSNVKFTNTDKVGYNFGIQLEYRFSQRWSANTGVIYTKKNYTAQGEDFNPPKGSWIDNVNLDLVSGSCDMFDIPLNVRYDVNHGNKHRYFVSTGLSTYLMKEEEYHYHYQYANGNPGYRYRTYESDEHHWLSILNISAGFEKKINKRLSIQGEPYLKVPLAGVGYGNLKLNSYGVYFSVRYNTGLLSGKE